MVDCCIVGVLGVVGDDVVVFVYGIGGYKICFVIVVSVVR